MLLASPFALFGLVNNFVPIAITSRLTNKIKDPMLHSTFQYAIGSVATFPIWYIILLVAASLISKSFLLDLHILYFPHLPEFSITDTRIG